MIKVEILVLIDDFGIRYLEPHLITYPSNMGVQLRRVTKSVYMSTLVQFSDDTKQTINTRWLVNLNRGWSCYVYRFWSLYEGRSKLCQVERRNVTFLDHTMSRGEAFGLKNILK